MIQFTFTCKTGISRDRHICLHNTDTPSGSGPETVKPKGGYVNPEQSRLYEEAMREPVLKLTTMPRGQDRDSFTDLGGKMDFSKDKTVIKKGFLEHGTTMTYTEKGSVLNISSEQGVVLEKGDTLVGREPKVSTRDNRTVTSQEFELRDKSGNVSGIFKITKVSITDGTGAFK